MHQVLSLFIISALSALALALQSDAGSARSATIYSWPHSSSKPSKLAEVSYLLYGHNNTITDFHPPSLPSFSDAELVRIGVYDPITKAWRGTVTSASSFGPSVYGRLRVNVNDAGDVWGASWHASTTKRSVNQKHDQFDVVMKAPAPQPVLNKPVMVSPDGKVEEKAPEKTMLQKYWWVFLAIAMLAMAGGGDK